MNTFIIAALTLDGKIAKSAEHNSYSWTCEEDKKFFVEKTKEAGVVIVGRKTWELIGKPLEGRLTIVMTQNPESYEAIADQVEFTNKSPKQILEDLESRGYKGAAVAGGAEVYAEFLRANLVDEMFLTIHSIIFGEGINFISGTEDIETKIIEAKQLSEQSILLKCKVIY